MEIVEVIFDRDHVAMRLDKGDPTDEQWHVIPSGIIEVRMEQWGLETREEALDLILVESHEDPDEEIPNRHKVDDLDAAKATVKRVVAAKAKNIKYAKGITRKGICDQAKVEPEMEEVIRQVTRESLASLSHVRPVSPQQSVSGHLKSRRDVGAGMERMSQERLADDIIQANQELKREPRVQTGETVGLTVKFT